MVSKLLDLAMLWEYSPSIATQWNSSVSRERRSVKANHHLPSTVRRWLTLCRSLQLWLLVGLTRVSETLGLVGELDSRETYPSGKVHHGKTERTQDSASVRDSRNSKAV